MGTRLPMSDARAAAGDPPPFERIGVVGYGLIGGSFGMAVKDRWPSCLVIAVDRKDVIETAMRMHAADVGGDDLVLLAEAQVIVLAAPVGANLEVLAQLAGHVPGEAIVTDVGGTKRDMVTAARGLPGRLQFVGGHPFAGTAAGGIRAARPDLFRGRPWVLTPEGVAGSPVPDLRPLIEGIGASVQVLQADEHDSLVAYLSHLPQLVATALMHVVGGRAGADGLALSGRGLRDTTRLAASPPGIWRDIVATNQDNIDSALEELIAALRRLQAGTAHRDEFDGMFESAAGWKRTLDRYFEPS